MNDWDLAAGHVLVTEAGGRVTTLDGQPIRYGERRPIACRRLVGEQRAIARDGHCRHARLSASCTPLAASPRCLEVGQPHLREFRVAAARRRLQHLLQAQPGPVPV